VTAAAARLAAGQNGMRPVDPRRDLAGLADVIESAFADNLDPSGRRMASEMRRFGRMGWFGWLVGRVFLPPAAFPYGYVWLEQGRIVGNASLMPVQGASDRWVLANVAVDPAHRRRGIGRALVGACIDLARRREVRQIVLQVKSDNAAAHRLYEAYALVDRGTRVTWRLEGAAHWPAETNSAARPRRPAEWQAHWELARRLAPLGVVWPHPLRSSQFRAASWMSTDAWAHYVWPNTGAIQAVLSGRTDSMDGGQWFLLSELPARGLAEIPLLERALRGQRSGAVTVESEAGVGDEAFRSLGFHEVHRLTWMSLTLSGTESWGST
jgi:ribosomal protein S18 acetylase RimI-like enzyme